MSLKYLDKRLIKYVLRLLKEEDFQGILTLEVFYQDDFEDSMLILNKYI